ncbi:MAG: hypothetical protein H6636_08850 [Anaerolineales bacterium]|nr:hypothetical protein [Anaerolineales bacterium]
MKYTHLTFFSILLLFLLASCTPAATEPPPTAASTPDLRTPLALTASAQTQLAADAQATVDAQATYADQTATAEADAAATASSLNATATLVMQRTQTSGTAQAKNTETAATRQASTQQAITEATEQAQPMVDLLEQLKADGYLNNTTGEYLRLPDHEQEQAKINYLDYFPTFLTPKNFVIRVDIAYQSASDTANWFNSSCGFLFRLDASAGNFYQAVMSLDGNVEFKRWKSSRSTVLQNGYYGTMDTPNGIFEMILVVEDSLFTVLINGEKVVHLQDTVLKEGDLVYTLTSGTNKDFGTRCSFTNLDLWTLK